MFNAVDLTFKCLVCPCFLANSNWIDQHIDGRRHQKSMEKFVILDQGKFTVSRNFEIAETRGSIPGVGKLLLACKLALWQFKISILFWVRDHPCMTLLR